MLGHLVSKAVTQTAAKSFWREKKIPTCMTIKLHVWQRGYFLCMLVIVCTEVYFLDEVYIMCTSICLQRKMEKYTYAEDTGNRIDSRSGVKTDAWNFIGTRSHTAGTIRI